MAANDAKTTFRQRRFLFVKKQPEYYYVNNKDAHLALKPESNIKLELRGYLGSTYP